MQPEEIPFDSHSLAFVESLYGDYVRDPASVSDDWRRFFASLAGRDGRFLREPQLGPTFTPQSLFHSAGTNGAATNGAAATVGMGSGVLQERVDQLIRAYRVRGHRLARVNPLGEPTGPLPELDLEFYGLGPADLDRTFSTRSLGGADEGTLRDLLKRLRNTYCRFIGVQFMHIDDLTVRGWLQERVESTENRLQLSRAEQLRILTCLTDAVLFEEFIQKRYLGAKSFSLEGSESLIPLLDLALEKAGRQRINEIVIAMAHRGRLNVLANIIGKSPQQIFHEFEDIEPAMHRGRGDVKYHLGYSSQHVTTDGHEIHLSLCFNPSHLEFVNPVASGRMRAKQDREGDTERAHGLVLMIHGDAAFAGEGVIQETLNLSQLPSYTTGGALHVVVNNQLGFTTPPEQARSSTYATDVAKMLQIPIFHVNGEDPESVAQVVNLAMDFRERFRRDVVLDMYCYRRRGHNEGDEPSFTQPLMYKQIEEQPTVRESYLDRLLLLGEITVDEADKIADESRARLEAGFSAARSRGYAPPPEVPSGVWEGFTGGREANIDEIDSGAAHDRLVELLGALTKVPEGFHVHPKIERLLSQRAAMATGERPLDWSTAEALAFATLATDGVPVRLSGQDCERGTFSQRHAVLHDFENGAHYTPLLNLSPTQATVEIVNSPLSEVGVLGFEYGYSLDRPSTLVMWEAQYGDFVNVAQVIIDQFIVTAEDKWRRLSGLTLLLPHGLEGAGPEHSSARLERFLTLAAEDNMQIAQPSTPAQYFHLLRRQALRRWRKPLVVMTPKSLLRHAAAVSPLDALTTGTYQRVIADEVVPNGAEVRRVLMCSGKVYYELAHKRTELARQDVAIIRIEQFYPFPYKQLRAALATYRDGTPVVWIQEEPENMGAWSFLRMQFGDRLFERLPLSGIYRRASASPATGSASSHRLEQDELIAAAFGGT
ncbi:MAG TPA: 2-oxoglutarate dehydrogenase E1 component [Pirellulales bacterium]|nr:2-oxoglutarate dehydrogenase E1 component [Pirellulales bacterium]